MNAHHQAQPSFKKQWTDYPTVTRLLAPFSSPNFRSLFARRVALTVALANCFRTKTAGRLRTTSPNGSEFSKLPGIFAWHVFVSFQRGLTRLGLCGYNRYAYMYINTYTSVSIMWICIHVWWISLLSPFYIKVNFEVHSSGDIQKSVKTHPNFTWKRCTQGHSVNKLATKNN